MQNDEELQNESSNQHVVQDKHVEELTNEDTNNDHIKFSPIVPTINSPGLSKDHISKSNNNEEEHHKNINEGETDETDETVIPTQEITDEGPVPLSDAITAYINFVLSTTTISPEVEIDIGFLLKEVFDDTGATRYNIILVNNINYIYMVTRKTWNYMVVKIYQYQDTTGSTLPAIGGLYKFTKTIVTLGTDRLINSFQCKFDPLDPIILNSGKCFTPFSTSFYKVNGFLSLLLSITVPLYLDPVDISDYGYKDHMQIKKLKEESLNNENIDNYDTKNINPTFPIEKTNSINNNNVTNNNDINSDSKTSISDQNTAGDNFIL